MADDNRPLKYMRYAIGEIVLVVVGILIALYINNWNEQRKEREKFDLVLVEVENEIIGNIQRAREQLNTFLNKKDSIISLVLNDELTYDDYNKDYSLESLLSNSRYVDIKTDAFNKLQQISGKIMPVQDSLKLALVNAFLPAQELLLYATETQNVTHRLSNEEYMKYSWYLDFMTGRRNEERIKYMLNNPEYKNFVVLYANKQQINLRYMTEGFEIEMRKVYHLIFNHLDKQQIHHNDSLYFSYKANDYIHYVGTYIGFHRSRPSMLKGDSTLITVESGKLMYQPFYEGYIAEKREIIPISKSLFRTELGRGFYRLTFDENNEVVELVWSDGIHRRKDLKTR